MGCLLTPDTYIKDIATGNAIHAVLLAYTEPNLRVLLNELHPVRDSWYKVGLQLDIPYTELNCFRKMYSDPSDSMCEVLMHWLKTAVDPPATWQAVVNALKSPIVNEVNVAAQLESKYCTQVQHTREHSPVEKSEGSFTYLF